MNLRDRRELVCRLEELRQIEGNGTSLISLYVPASSGQRARANELLKKEITFVDNIKDRKVRNAVKNALFATQQKFRSFCKSDFEPNGIALFVGEDVANNGRMSINMIKPTVNGIIKNVHYACGKRFDLDMLAGSVESNEQYGIVVISGQQLYIGTVAGEQRKCLLSHSVDLPKKHCKGGQSQGRFNRQRL